MITFSPKQDITAYEASLVAWGLVHEDYIRNLPENVKRHFIITDEKPTKKNKSIYQRLLEKIGADMGNG